MLLIHRFPAACIAVLFSAGIMVSWQLSTVHFLISLGLAVGCTLAAVAASVIESKHQLFTLVPLLKTVCISLAIVALGAAMHTAQVQVPAGHVSYITSQHHDVTRDTEVTAFGRIAEPPQQSAHQLRVVLEADSVSKKSSTWPVTGKIQITQWLNQDTEQENLLRTGDVVRVSGTLEPTPRPRNPADFNYGQYLERRGIHGIIVIESSEDLHISGRAPRWRDRVIQPVRSHINTQIDQHLPTDDARHVLRALLLGDRSGIDDDRRQQFVRTGLMHLLAVSGLHVLLVGFVLYQLLRPFLMRLGLSWQVTEVTRAVGTMAVLLLYMFLTEARPSVARATLMAGLFIGSSVLQRNSDSLNTLGVAALILLMFAPSQLFDVGFQLSFSAVAAILLLNPPLQRWITGGREDAWWNYFATIFTTTVAATIGTLPVLLTHFGFASFAGLWLNLLAIPATALGLAGGLLMVLAGVVWPALASILGHAADIFLHVLLQTASVGLDLFGWASVDASLGVFSGAMMLGGIGATVGWNRPRLRWGFIMLITAVATLAVWDGVLGEEPTLEVIFFDVGQGSAALAKLPDGGHALFDTGVRNPFVDSGERTLVPHLKKWGIDRLDAVIISHPHSDHLGGLAAVLREIPVDTVYHNGDQLPTAVFEETEALIDSLDVGERVVRKGDLLSLGPSVLAKVLYPTDEALRRGNVNDASAVIRLTYEQTSFLFLGDAEEYAERDMKRFLPSFLGADVVQVGHHGSATSSTPLFVRQLVHYAPEDVHAVISAGGQNRYGHPSEDVLGRWHRKKATVHWTALQGAVWLSSDGKSVTERKWR